jgi:DNA-binding IclR family transcriptional regulator
MPKPTNTRKPKATGGRYKPIQSLQKGLRILSTFTLPRPEWGVRELGRELKINATTTFRLLKTLEDVGYVERNPVTQHYMLGPRVVELAELYAHLNPMPSVALKVFANFRERFQFNFYLGALRARELVYLARLEGHGPIYVSAEPGERISLHSSALGKVLLAFQDETFIDAYLQKTRLKAYTPRTITDHNALRKQLALIRKQGWALNDGERYEDVGAVGVPVSNGQDQAIASVSLAYPRYLVQEERLVVPEMIALAREIAGEIASRCRNGMASQVSY